MTVNVRQTERLDWRKFVMPVDLRKKPIHRWFVFPHSFTDDLVRNLVIEWELDHSDHILDPFVGAGTTILTAKEMGIPAHGVDLSPFAVFVTKVKVGNYQISDIQTALEYVRNEFEEADTDCETALLRRAFTESSLRRLCGLRNAIRRLQDRRSRDFLLLGLLSILRDFSSIRADGGWLRLNQPRLSSDRIFGHFYSTVNNMISDLPNNCDKSKNRWEAVINDARQLAMDGKYTAVITSPPYPNRHDYSRIFGIELEFAFFNNSDTFNFRYNSIRSHPEAKEPKEKVLDYIPPKKWSSLLGKLEQENTDKRIPVMLSGYFEDMYSVLTEMRKHLADGAKVSLVVGNARYFGIVIPVDEILAEIAADVGFEPLEIRTVRLRGNSAQQMGRYGREPSRESCVILKN